MLIIIIYHNAKILNRSLENIFSIKMEQSFYLIRAAAIYIVIDLGVFVTLQLSSNQV